jgi:hypothetical protein
MFSSRGVEGGDGLVLAMSGGVSVIYDSISVSRKYEWQRHEVGM